ncbi:arylamine N-acetyltransferase [Kitasatospora sp. NPDC056446]|uniref:arylamine N-acetyltransferase n=1 Tax=Kitasatospora sp. NPDC056446 TaxID=3345819 RepID=UPI00369F1136
MNALSPDTLRQVTAWLGLPAPPAAPTLAALTDVYRRWCTRVPFDNLLIRVALAAGGSEVRGMRPDDFLRTAMARGVGNLCMESAEALQALLTAYGFDAALGLGQIGGDSGTLRTNHVTVVVTVDGFRHVVDTTLLTGTPLALVDGNRTDGLVPYAIDRRPDGLWQISTLSLVGRKPKLIRILAVTRAPAVAEALYRSLQGADYRRANGAYFAQLRTEDGAVVTVGRGSWYRTGPAGVERTAIPDEQELHRVLVDVLGVATDTARLLPADA